MRLFLSGLPAGLLLRRCGIVICLTLTGCYGPWGTCRTGCQSGYTRDIFCECQKDVPGVTPSPPIYGPVAGRDFIWAATPQCSLNTIVYLFNITDQDVIATYSYRNGNVRQRKKLSVKRKIFGYDDAVKNNTVLGYNMLDDKDCTLVDYQLESSSAAFAEQYPEKEPAIKSLIERSKAETASTLQRLQARSVNKVDGQAIRQGPTLLAEPKVVHTEVKILNCPQECNGDTPTLRCLKGTPPDQTKVRAIQQKLMQPLKTNVIGIDEIQKLAGQANECDRQDIKATPNTLLNNGQACAYPFYFSSSDSVPSIVIHYPTTVSANRVDQHNLSVIEFKAPAETPTLNFRDKDIDEVWGGRIVQISTDSKGVYYQTTGGCVALEIK